ncbi:hypothetical protein BKA70DRAFT_1403453 [Coprinopsis sp. MPI-PUGE-AT-0042]|nr:hypothetical protein BKA70DRAFT_1403453 [Coprinopsis sp. MPI-PUGE-AT-0042]
MMATDNYHEGIVRLLLARSEIQVNLIDNEGRSALRLAACGGHDVVLDLLLAVPHIETTTRSAEDGHIFWSLENMLGADSEGSEDEGSDDGALNSEGSDDEGSSNESSDDEGSSSESSDHEISGSESFEDEDSGSDGVDADGLHDEGADNNRAQVESSSLSRSAKRLRSNEENSLQGAVDGMAAPAPKRRRAAEDVEDR